MVQLIASQLQLNYNSIKTTHFQLLLLKSLIIIHLLKSNTWHCENFGH
jgi:hypothetical protein